ncbi:adenosylcobinamide-phosphate synthase CbiB [Cystobacter fuscus]|uniref:adenosylcobinamide-phosphate synthase CbiB n=1 Tax=Cystobacter fuscus TaxID=43 RepID=UPI0037C0BD48
MMDGGLHAVLVLVAALGVDLAWGEPPTVLHPVVWMGRLQRRLRRLAPRAPVPAFLHGLVMAVTGPAVFGLGAWALLRLVSSWPLVQLALEVYLLKSAFAVRALAEAGLAVFRALSEGDAPAARFALRSLVSRDTSGLEPPLLAAAAVESVAENTSDSVVAPLLFYAVAGVPGALAYRAANTLDAMIGYRGELEWLGKAAARLDDVLNLVPARLSAALLVLACALCGASPARAVISWWRDGAATESPNAGRPMAAVAGGLGVELEKVGHYRLGAGGRQPGAEDIRRAVFLMVAASLLAAALTAAYVYGEGFRVALASP